MEKDNIYLGNNLNLIKELDDESVDLIVTSPPYYNAREYSSWDSVEEYLSEMRELFTLSKTKLKNHHNIVVNVGDVTIKEGKSTSTKRKLPLGAYFIVLLEEIGYRYIDDYIWDKGEVQSKRNFAGGNYPYGKYPHNVYEHILVFSKNDKDAVRPLCPVCNDSQPRVNGIVNGIQTYECKNPLCESKSQGGRGKRFSHKSIMTDNYNTKDNLIDEETLSKWRKDIVQMQPVFKINNKKENTLGHSAPFPKELPEMAIKYFSGVGDIVLDPYSGSGTTAKVAKELKRHYIGFELDKGYYKSSIESLKEESNV